MITPVQAGNVIHREVLEVVVGPHEAARIVLSLLRALLGALLASLLPRHELALENLALRQQLGVLRRSVKLTASVPTKPTITHEIHSPMTAPPARHLGNSRAGQKHRRAHVGCTTLQAASADVGALVQASAKDYPLNRLTNRTFPFGAYNSW